MHRLISNLYLFLLLFVLMSCDTSVDVPDPPQPEETTEVSINPSKTYQTMDGFGASDAWRCQFVGKNWPLEKRDAIADLLFSQETDASGSPKGIGLSIWRFYLGAGSAEQGAASNIPDEWRRGECFLKADGTYDWSKQEGQRWFLQAAKQRGVDKFLAFSISPPVSMTTNGKAFAAKKQTNMNIKEGMMPAYADFMVESVVQLQAQEGIKFDYLSPVNEPQWDWAANDQGQNSQEGTPATNAELASLTQLLSDRLSARSLQTEVVLSEAATIEFLYKKVNNDDRDDQVNVLFADKKLNALPNVANCVSGHSYFTVWPISDQIRHRESLAARIKQLSPTTKYWQSEYCILENPGSDQIPNGNGNKRDLGIKTALFVARIIHNDIALAGASSWQWWTALTRVDYKDGLIYLDEGTPTGNPNANYCKNDGNYHDSKLMWALGNYSYFVRPGMVRVEIGNASAQSASENVMLSAYKDESKKKLVIVAVNVSNTEKKYNFDVADGIIKGNTLTPYVTSEQYNLRKQAAVGLEGVNIPAQSVVTYVGDLN